MISKLAWVEWPAGTFIDTVKIWQKEWFYITEPRGADWVMAPEFRFGPPTRLTSWTTKGIDWGSPTEVAALQKRIFNIIQAKTHLTNVVQVMLRRRLLPLPTPGLPNVGLQARGPNHYTTLLRHHSREVVEGRHRTRCCKPL